MNEQWQGKWLDFPIHSDEKRPGPRSVPWSFVLPHKRWAERNHGQTLVRLAERGGLSFCELAAIVEHRSWRSLSDAEVARFVATLPKPGDVTASGKGQR